MSEYDASKLFSVTGLVAVITGGGTGIGLMMAKALALNGAHKVYIIGRRKEVLEAAAKESPHGNIIPMVGDVTSKDNLQAIANEVKAEIGYVNVFIANSGVGGPQVSKLTPQSHFEDFHSTMWNADFEDYTKTFAVNTAAVYFSIIAFIGLLDAGNKRGNIEQKSQAICTSSIAGFHRKVPGGYAYGQSKAAATHMMKQLATNLAPYDIRANVIAPGLYPSELAAGIIGNGVFPRELLPAQRPGTPKEMAGAILYLTSRAGGYCNGSVIVTDGGRLSQLPSAY